jgi:hypothetical protein
MNRPALTMAVVGGSLLSLALPVGATDYEFDPRVELAGGYNDNANLSVVSADRIGSGEALLDARVDLIARESNWQWRVTPEARGTWFPSDSDIDSNGEFLYLNGQRSGPRYTLGLDGYGSSQSLLPSYLPTANLGTGLGTSEPGATLVTPASIRENLGYLSPTYTFAMTQRQSLELSATYTDATFSREFEAVYVNYQNITGSAGLVLRATPTGSLTVRALAQDFRPDFGNTTGTTDTYGGEVQWDGKLSATKQYYLRAGAVRTDFSSVPGTAAASNSTNWTGGAGTQWTYSVTEIFLDVLRTVAPTAQGYVVNQDLLRLRLAQRFTPRLAGFVGVRVIYQDPVPGTLAPNAQTQHYNFATAGFEWRIARQFSLIGAYDFTEYRSPGAPSTGRANAILLSVVYEPHRPAEGPAITVGY